jgi:hypothetical protein
MIESENGEQVWAKVFVIGDRALDSLVQVGWPPEADRHPLGDVEGQEPGWRSFAFTVAVPCEVAGKPLILYFIVYQLGLFGARTDEIRQAAHGLDALLVTHRDNKATGHTERATMLIEQITQVPSPVQGLQLQPSRLVWLGADPQLAAPPGFELMVETGLPVAHICDDTDWWSLAVQLGHELAARAR